MPSTTSTEHLKTRKAVYELVTQLKLFQGDHASQQAATKAAVTLRVLTAKSPASRTAFAELEGLDLLRRIIKDGRGDQLRLQAAMQIMENMAGQPPICMRTKLGEHVIPPLLALLQQSGTQEVIMVQALHTLRVVLHDDKANTNIFKQLSGVSIAVQLLADNSSPSPSRSAQDLLYALLLLVQSLIRHHGLTELADAGVSTPLLQLLHCGCSVVRETAVDVVCTYAASATFFEFRQTLAPLIAAGAVPYLLQAANSQHSIPTLYKVVETLHCLVSSERFCNKSVPLSPHDVAAILEFLSRHGSDNFMDPSMLQMLNLLKSLLSYPDAAYVTKMAADLVAADGLSVLLSLQLGATRKRPIFTEDIMYRLALSSGSSAVPVLANLLQTSLRDSSQSKAAQCVVLDVLSYAAQHLTTFPELAMSSSLVPALLNGLKCLHSEGLHSTILSLLLKAAASPCCRQFCRQVAAQDVLQDLLSQHEKCRLQNLSSSSLGDVKKLMQLLREQEGSAVQRMASTSSIPGSAYAAGSLLDAAQEGGSTLSPPSTACAGRPSKVDSRAAACAAAGNEKAQEHQSASKDPTAAACRSSRPYVGPQIINTPGSVFFSDSSGVSQLMDAGTPAGSERMLSRARLQWDNFTTIGGISKAATSDICVPAATSDELALELLQLCGQLNPGAPVKVRTRAQAAGLSGTSMTSKPAGNAASVAPPTPSSTQAATHIAGQPQSSSCNLQGSAWVMPNQGSTADHSSQQACVQTSGATSLNATATESELVQADLSAVGSSLPKVQHNATSSQASAATVGQSLSMKAESTGCRNNKGTPVSARLVVNDSVLQSYLLPSNIKNSKSGTRRRRKPAPASTKAVADVHPSGNLLSGASTAASRAADCAYPPRDAHPQNPGGHTEPSKSSLWHSDFSSNIDGGTGMVAHNKALGNTGHNTGTSDANLFALLSDSFSNSRPSSPTETGTSAAADISHGIRGLHLEEPHSAAAASAAASDLGSMTGRGPQQLFDGSEWLVARSSRKNRRQASTQAHLAQADHATSSPPAAAPTGRRQAPVPTSAGLNTGSGRGVVESREATVAGELVVKGIPAGETRRMLLQPLEPSLSTEHNLLTLQATAKVVLVQLLADASLGDEAMVDAVISLQDSVKDAIQARVEPERFISRVPPQQRRQPTQIPTPTSAAADMSSNSRLQPGIPAARNLTVPGQAISPPTRNRTTTSSTNRSGRLHTPAAMEDTSQAPQAATAGYTNRPGKPVAANGFGAPASCKEAVSNVCSAPATTMVTSRRYRNSEDDGSCTICMDAVASMMLLPCKHSGFCATCAALMLSSDTCPFCRCLITGTQDVQH